MIKKICLTLGLLALFMLAPILVGLAKGEMFNKNNNTKIIAYNPYSMKVELEVKCDYNSKRGEFTYHRFFVIPKKSNVVIVVPNLLKECQVWPHVIFW